MRKFLSSFLRKILSKIDKEEPISNSFSEKKEVQEEVVESVEAVQTVKPKVKAKASETTRTKPTRKSC